MRLVAHSTDYQAASTDDGVLRLPSRTELRMEEISNVFGYSRNLHTQFMLGRVIGAGSFGVVRECIERATGRRYAIKTVGKAPKRGPPTPRYLLKLRTEVEIMQQLGFSLDAVNLKAVFEDNDAIHLVMELCDGGALLERVESQVYSEKYIARLVRSILRFITQCHAKGIIYRDIKPDNFLFLTKERDSPLKATDFGLSIRHWPDEPKLTSRSGTPAYMAPELVMQNYDERCDLWSVGMLTYQLLTGRFPFWEDVRNESVTDVWRAILTEEISWKAPELRQLSPSAIDFLQGLLQRDPTQRPSASQSLEHPWVREEGSAAADLPLQFSVVQRLQRFSTYGHLKQMVLRMIVEELADQALVQAKGGQQKQQQQQQQQRAAAAAVPAQEEAQAQQSLLSPEGGVIKGLQELFNQLDTDGSGGISYEELRTGLRKLGYVLTESEFEQLVRKVDANGDANISLREFMTTLIDWNSLQREQYWQVYLDHAFARLDDNGDGYISLEELLGHLLPIEGPALSAAAEQERLAEAKRMLREADTNGDGRISREEFYDLLRDSHAPDSLSFYDDRLDENHRALISAARASSSSSAFSSGSVSSGDASSSTGDKGGGAKAVQPAASSSKK